MNREKSETEREHHQEVDVAPCDHLVDGDLHVEGGGQDQELQDHGENEDLNERVAASGKVGPENGKEGIPVRSSSRRNPSVGES